MSIVGWFKEEGESGFGFDSTADEVSEGLDLSGKTVVITGCNSGIGFECARVSAMRGATVFALARSEEKAHRTCEELPGEAVPFVCDLAEPAVIRDCVERIAGRDEALDAVVANAGIMALPELNQVHGYERQFFVNHVGHFMLVTGLIDRIAEDGRVVVVSSDAHRAAPDDGIQFENLSGEDGYHYWRAYGQSKFANLLFARQLARRFDADPSHERSAVAVHPGAIDTNLTRHLNTALQWAWSLASPLFLKTIPQGAATQTWAAVHPDAADLNGEYLADCNIEQPDSRADDPEKARRLWQVTEEIVDDVTE